MRPAAVVGEPPASEFQVGLVNQGRRIHGFVATPVATMRTRDRAELVVDRVEQRITGFPIACRRELQQLRDVPRLSQKRLQGVAGLNVTGSSIAIIAVAIPACYCVTQ